MRIDQYDWAGGREAMLRFGPVGAPVVVAALPLLEEANRTRAFVVAILRALAGRGIAGALPDLPGTGESVVATGAMTLADLQRAYAAAAAACDRPIALAIRSGALVVGGPLRGRWLLAPQTGEELTREWRRLVRAGAREDAVEEGLIAGNPVNPGFLASLAEQEVGMEAPLRVVRLDGDPRPADAVVPGTPLWRRAEPGNDVALAERLAADIAGWVARCAG